MIGAGGGKTGGKARAAWFGLALGLVGAALDFYSYYQMATYQTPMMGIGPGPIWAPALAALGVLLVVSAVAGASSFGAARMPLFGGLMVLYGALMLLLGAEMGGAFPGMQAASSLEAGMIVVGALMIINGAVMVRMKRMPQA